MPLIRLLASTHQLSTYLCFLEYLILSKVFLSIYFSTIFLIRKKEITPSNYKSSLAPSLM